MEPMSEISETSYDNKNVGKNDIKSGKKTH